MRTPGLPLALVVALAFSAPAIAQKKTRRMTDEAVKAAGLTLQKLVDADLDGDGRRELLGVTSGPKGIQLVVVGEDAEGAVVSQVLPPAVGKELLKVEVKHLVGPATAQQLIIEVLDETPDEKVKRLRVYGADGEGTSVRAREIFFAKIERSRNPEARPEWETDPNVVKYGDPRAGWFFEDLQGDGSFEVLVRRNSGAKLIPVKAADGSEIKFLTGVRETVYTWDAAKARFSKGEERLVDFLPAYAVAAVEASSVWVEPQVLKDLKAKALSEALQRATATAAAPDAGPAGAAKAPEPSSDVKVDLSPFIKAAADGNIATSWIEGDVKGDGAGEWVEVTLDEEDVIHMVRLVLGCAESDSSMKSHNVPETFSIQLDVGSAREVNRKTPGVFAPGVVAFTDDLVKLADRPWVRTTLVFLDGKTEAKKVRVALGKATKQGRTNQTCISEISVH